MMRLPLADDDGGHRMMVKVPVVDVSLQVAFVLGAKGAVRATEGRRLAALV